MEKTYLSWSLYRDNQEESMERYCHNCGKKTLFKDTLVRRHNANGKNIYQYAIYKCQKDHTWNKKLDIYKARTQSAETMVEIEKVFNLETIEIRNCVQKETKEVVIYLEVVEGKWRLDKLLSKQIADLSRTEIVTWIKQGKVLVDGVTTKPSIHIKSHQHICISLSYDFTK
jgi:hypothetical protein